MRSRAGVWTSIALALTICLPSQAAAGWTRLKTGNFLFIGDASERTIREVAQHLEQFRDVMSRALPPAAVSSSVPTVVFVFQTEKSFAPYKPRFQGRQVDVSGYFQGARDVNYVAINAANGAPSLRTIFHEYAHFLVRNTTGELPVWANEGLAGVYETFEDRDGGKSAILGSPNASHLLLLQNSTLMPLRELLDVDHSSPIYNEGDRRGLLYAQSWALMHYLMLGNQARAPQLRNYLQRLKGGTPSPEAFQQAFAASPEELEPELRDYIRRFAFPVVRLDFGEKVVGGVAGRGEAIDEVEARAYLADLMARMGRQDDARAELTRLVDANTGSARALGMLGMLEYRAGRLDAALPLLERAVALDDSDGTVQQARGRLLFSRWQEASEELRPEALRNARAALARAVELSPGDAEITMLLGRLESVGGSDARATSLLERAVSLAPREDRYRLMLADALVRQRQFARATSLLGPLVAGAADPEVKESARDLMAYMARLIQATADVPAALPEDRDSSSGPVPPSSRRTAAGGRFVPQFRRVGAGERRVLGSFTTVECRPGAAVLVIEAEGETLRIATDDLSKVEFITYRDQAPGAVGCGALRPGPRVFATFKEDDAPAGVSGVDGHAIAIELLPDDFVPQ